MVVHSEQRVYYRMRIDLGIRFQTAFHLGSGIEGDGGSDHGIMTDAAGRPLIPGSSLKGVLRSTVEKLVATLGVDGLWACGLQNGLYSERECIGDHKGDIYKKANDQYQKDSSNTELIEQNRCSACSLFGSPLSAGRIYIDDAHLLNSEEFSLSCRDGVGICRDSGTAMDKIKYNYDAANAGLCYQVSIEVERATERDLELLALGILEWKHAGIRLGGKTTRGLGHAQIEEIGIRTVDLHDREQRKSYILRGEMVSEENPDSFLQQKVERILDGEPSC